MDYSEPFVDTRAFLPQEEAVNAIVCLHEHGGVEQVSLSAIARHIRCGRSSVHQAHGGLAGLYVSLSERFGYRWRSWIADAPHDDVPIRLPRDDMDRLGVLTWSSLRSIAAAEARAGRPEAWTSIGHADVATRYALIRRIRALLGVRLGSVDAGDRDTELAKMPDEALTDGLLALAEGLRLRLVEPQPSITHDVAMGILRVYWTDVLGLPIPTGDGEHA